MRAPYPGAVRTLLACALLGAVLAASASAAAVVPARNGEIVFSSVRAASGPNRFFDLHLMRADGTRVRRITGSRAWERFSAWSPDGRWIAYISDRSRPGHEGSYEIYVMRPNGSGLRRLTRDRWIDDQLAWSPDGRQLAFVSNRSGGRFGIWVMNVNGTGFRRLTNDGEGLPAWSPDGRTIAYQRFNPRLGRSGTYEIWLMNPDGSNQRQLTFPPHSDTGAEADDYMPEWAPSGDALAFARRYRGRTDIHVIRSDGSGLRRLTRQAGQHTWPAWSPDGRRIAFVTALRPKRAIYSMNVDGSGLRRLTAGAVEYAYPDWQPIR
jgi:Tol biopolymer transport system component